MPAALAAQALPAAYGPGAKTVLSGGLSFYQQDYGKRQIAGGFTTLDVHPHWRYGIEGEARVLHLHTSQQVTQSTYLGGLRVNLTFRPARLQPYAKVLAGMGRITLPYNYAHGNFLTYAGGGTRGWRHGSQPAANQAGRYLAPHLEEVFQHRLRGDLQAIDKTPEVELAEGLLLLE